MSQCWYGSAKSNEWRRLARKEKEKVRNCKRKAFLQFCSGGRWKLNGTTEIRLQLLPFENQQSTVYIVSKHFLRKPNR